MREDTVPVIQQSAVLADVEACRRRALLITLQEALAVHGVRSLLVGRHILALRASAPFEPSGPADPELHVHGASSCDVITTDGLSYRLSSGPAVPADDPAAAAEHLSISR